MGGWPNYWSMCVIDHNIRQLENSSAYLIGPYDGQSIMKYHFPAFMYKQGQQSVCYSQQNNVLSAGDKAGAARLYPQAVDQIEEIANRMATLTDQALSREALTPDVHSLLTQQKERFPGR